MDNIQQIADAVQKDLQIIARFSVQKTCEKRAEISKICADPSRSNVFSL